MVQQGVPGPLALPAGFPSSYVIFLLVAGGTLDVHHATWSAFYWRAAE